MQENTQKDTLSVTDSDLVVLFSCHALTTQRSLHCLSLSALAVVLGTMLAALPGRGYADGEGNNLPARFAVTTDVIRTQDQIKPIGVNRLGDPGGTKYSRNTFVRNSGNEPINQRLMARYCYSFPDGGIHIDSGTTLWNGTLKSGFLSGAGVRVYRLVDKDGNKLPTKKAGGKDYDSIDPKTADHVAFVGKTRVVPIGDKKLPMGGWVAISKPSEKKPDLVEADLEKCRVYFTDQIDLHPGDYIFFEKRNLGVNPDTIKARDKISWSWRTKNCAQSLQFHSAPIPEEMRFAGEGCLRLDSLAGACSVDQYSLFGAGGYYGPLEDGKQYRMEVWLRQEGLTGPVEFGFTGLYERNETFPVTGKWQKFTCDFVGKKPTGKNLYGPLFRFQGPGTLWMDNCRIFRYDNEEELNAVFTPGKLTLEKLLDSQPQSGPKGTLRFWDGLGQMSMKSLVSMYGDSSVSVNHLACYIRGTLSLPYALMSAEATGDSPADRMVPWLIIQVTFTEEGYRGLIEYLGDPYDPAEDTAESKPWAHVRYQQRGHGRPWTDTFSEIIFEFGNENWHNRYPIFPFWVGFGELSAIHQGGKEYGIWTRYYIEEIMKHPCWTAQQLDKRIKFNLGGNYSARIDAKTGRVYGYGQEATQQNPYSSYEGHATYIGPLWELRQNLKRELNDEGFQGTLLSYEAGSKSRNEAMSESYHRLREQGFTKHEIVSYETGPSGFSIFGKGLTKEDLKTIQLYGKSKAIGIASLDCWLDTYRLGWTHHCYYFYGQGDGWNSHSTIEHGFLPSPAFLAMKMRNRCIRGEMLATKVESTPTITYGQTGSFTKALEAGKKGGGKAETREVPLVKCYAFRDGDRYAVAVLSLKLDGKHNGQDFGDGYSPVTIRLPFESAAAISMMKLVGDPRDNNREEIKVKLVEQSLPSTVLRDGLFHINETTGGAQGGIPPGTAFVYVFDGTKG